MCEYYLKSNNLNLEKTCENMDVILLWRKHVKILMSNVRILFEKQ